MGYKESKIELISRLKKDWKKDDQFEDFKKEYVEELRWFFEEFFPDEKSCKKQLLFWLGWKIRGDAARFKCPNCECRVATVALKKEGKRSRERLVLRCNNSKCRNTPSPQSVTMMAGSRLPLKFWFLCIYVIGLTNGKVPWTYLNEQRVGFESGESSRTIQKRDMANILHKILEECHSLEMRMKYCRLVRVEYQGHKVFKTYLSWYNSQSWTTGWLLAFQDFSVKSTFFPKLVSSDNYENEPQTTCLLKDKNVQEYDWILIVRIDNKRKISGTKWMYVSMVEKITNKKSKSYKKGYRYLAIQRADDPITDDQPFKIESKFENALLRTWEQTKKRKKLLGLVKNPTTAWLDKIDCFLGKD